MHISHRRPLQAGDHVPVKELVADHYWRLIEDQKSMKAAAPIAGVSPRTISRHLDRIRRFYEKLPRHLRPPWFDQPRDDSENPMDD